MKKSVRTTPSHSLVLVLDSAASLIPETLSGELIAATRSCVAIGTLSEYDGETTIHLADEYESHPTDKPRFDDVLQTPSRVVRVCSILHEPMMELPIPSDLTRVRVWVNDDKEPDDITIVLGG